MATTKQISYLRDLMVGAGMCHRKGYLNAASKSLPHSPTMRERGGDFDSWAESLTPAQASGNIRYLMSRRQSH